MKGLPETRLTSGFNSPVHPSSAQFHALSMYMCVYVLLCMFVCAFVYVMLRVCVCVLIYTTLSSFAETSSLTF